MEHFVSNKKMSLTTWAKIMKGIYQEAFTAKAHPCHHLQTAVISMDFWPFSDHFGSSFQGSMSSAVLICASFSRMPLLEASIASPHRACETKDLKVWNDQQGSRKLQKSTQKIWLKKKNCNRKPILNHQSVRKLYVKPMWFNVLIPTFARIGPSAATALSFS